MSTTTNSNPSESTSVHGHEVMHLLLAQGQMSRPALASLVESKLGKGICFHTCSASDMSLDGLLDFLAERGKIDEGPQGVAMRGAEHICSHGDGEHDHKH